MVTVSHAACECCRTGAEYCCGVNRQRGQVIFFSLADPLMAPKENPTMRGEEGATRVASLGGLPKKFV